MADDAQQTAPIDVEKVLAALTLEEKVALTSGDGFWHTEAVPRVGLGRVMVADGPHGLRKEVVADDGTRSTVPATCFPPAVTLGSTWDADLVRDVGAALGRETAAQDVAVLLGPGINIKRSPLCGRNFEYLSEDPHVAGVLGAAVVEGLQGEGVGASLKHFAVNNQETDRMRVDAVVDQRTLREIYLAGFERVVTQASPWTVMCAYNRVNGTHASRHHQLLTEILRDEWGYEGLVMSDWGAVHDQAAAVPAGLDLRMPGVAGRSDAEVVAAVRDGSLAEADLDLAVRRVLNLVDRAARASGQAGPVDHDAHHALAREAAARGAVLLKNDPVDGTPLLPLDPAGDLVVLGELARTARFQGAGSSQVEATRVEDVLSSLRALVGDDTGFAAGYTLDGDEAADAELRTEAVELAGRATTAVLVLGLPAAEESEGFDRTHLRLPASQTTLLAEVARVCPRVVIVLANGSAVSVSGWQDHAPAVLESWLGGQAGGAAVADLLVGRSAPSGRLTETIPHALEDTPAYGRFPGGLGEVVYGEGVLVGYRWYDTRGVDVAYPFGHGLTYTTFDHTDLVTAVHGEGADVRVDVQVTVTNTGERAGAEVVQVYVGDPESQVQRPTRELRAFVRVPLEPGESRTVDLTLTARDLAYWHEPKHRWFVEGGRFTVSVGASSRDLRLHADLDVVGESLSDPLTTMSTLGEALDHPAVGERFASLLGEDGDAGIGAHAVAMMREFTLGQLADFAQGSIDRDRIDELLAASRAS
ncbi:glycoside hydrolase family 3 C-terminal domain-containing protein [Solicola sp. PLA-1-18]|uniref:glycoside hydrolase family 3 C-terminal domain-containing protein n=1 Tax=Solicola sp. PLA-1-18 TaxID=3380532 RepID=UPI003B8100CE